MSLGSSLPLVSRPFSCPRAHPESGLTLIELLITIFLIGILGGFAAVRYAGRFDQSLAMQADRLRRNLAHAQILAISQSKRLKFTAATTQYKVEECSNVACTTTTALTDPVKGTAFVVTLDNGAVMNNTGSFLIDNLGRPANSSGLISTSPAFTFQLGLNGRTRSVTLMPLTGFAQVQP